MSGGIIDRRDSGAFVPRGGDGRYEEADKPTGIHEIHGAGEGVQDARTEPDGQPALDVVGGPESTTPEPPEASSITLERDTAAAPEAE